MEVLLKFFYRTISALRLTRHSSLLAHVKTKKATMRTITVSPEAFTRIVEFATFYDMPIRDALNKAITEWMEATGDLMKAFTENDRRKVVTRSKLTLVKRSN